MAAKRSFDIMAKINAYEKPKTADSEADRVAHFLNWAASELPHLPIPWNVVHRAINGFTRTSKLDNKDVIDLRKKSTPIRRVLFEKYKRELAVVPGQGVCATINSDHVVATRGKVTYNRIVGATKSFERTMSLVNTREMKDPQNKLWAEKTMRALGDMSLSDRLNKLLPPKEGEGQK